MKNLSHAEIDRLADEIREGDSLENLDILVDALKTFLPEFPPGTLVDLPMDDDQIVKRESGHWHYIGLRRRAYLDDDAVRGFIREGQAVILP